MTADASNNGALQMVADPILGEEVWIGRTSLVGYKHLIELAQFSEPAGGAAGQIRHLALGFRNRRDPHQH